MILVKCSNCKIDVVVYPKRFSERKNIFCSKRCEGEYKSKNNPNYIPCDTCGKIFYKKPNKIKKDKNHFCSRNCLSEFMKIHFVGENNPNYGNRGLLNPIYNKDERMVRNGYIWIKVANHPFLTKDGWIREHRLVAENNLYLDDSNSVLIDGKRYLSPYYDVHHINMNKKDNRPENLIILTRSEHKSLHHKLNKKHE